MRLSRPVTVVVAAPGYGKTYGVRRLLADGEARWYTDVELAGRELDALVEPAAPIVIDSTGRVPPGELPAGARIVLISRTPLAGPVPAWRARGLVTDIGPTDLALTPAEVARLPGLAAGDGARPQPPAGSGPAGGGLSGTGSSQAAAAAVHALTAGWPALARMVAAMPCAGATTVAELRALACPPGAAPHSFVHDVVLPALPRAARRLVGDLAQFDDDTPVSEELAELIDPREGRRALRLLSAVGLLQPSPSGRLVPLVAAVLREAAPPTRRRRLLSAAAGWYAGQDRPVEAVRAAATAGDPARCAELVTRYGARLLGAGAADTVIAAVRTLPAGSVAGDVALWYAEALYVTGAVDDALALYARLAAGTAPLPAGLAWRYGLVRYRAGDADAGLGVFLRGRIDASADGALLLGWLAAAYWMLGDATACRAHATRAHVAAVALGDARCLAAAHVALALLAQLDGDRPGVQANYDRALAVAEAGRDVFAIVRIRTNRASSLLHEARYCEALEMIGPAVSQCDSAGYVTLLGPALCNEGTALYRLGRLDEAVARFERAATLYQRLRSDRMAYPLLGLGDVYRQRGRTAQARAAYEEAIRVADNGGDRQVRSHALAGLARVVAGTDPPAAAQLATRALADAPGPVLAAARLAAGWAAAAAADNAPRGDPVWLPARRLADEAADAARRHRDRAALAEALELRGHAAADAATARTALTEALAIWRDAGAEVDADRVRLALAPATGQRDDRAAATLAALRLAAAGVLPLRPDRIRIDTLGRFAVWQGGQPVPATAWQSRKARDLLRVLVARRGRVISRDELADLLWPGEPADRVAHRLSVALSTVRTVLDPDRCAAPDDLIVADNTSLALNTAAVTVDAETFAEYARHGLAALRAGQPTQAGPALEAAERLYIGDFLRGRAVRGRIPRRP